jgi:anti-anti-sigma factor
MRATNGVVPGPIDFNAVVVGCEDGRVQVVLRGELDIVEAPALLAAIVPLLGRTGLRVELDAQELSFLDASGIGCFVRCRNLLRARGGELTIHSPSLQLRRLLGICGLTGLLGGDLAGVVGRGLIEL